MEEIRQVLPDIAIIPSFVPVHGAGVLPVNAFVIKAAEPVLIDTGMAIESDEFMRALESIIDLQDLKWVWLTHDDVDHTGSLPKIIEAAPGVKLATNSLAALRMNTAWPVPLDRVHWLNSGDSINVGDRKLTAVRPPLFDNPTTIGIYDDKSNTFFPADCFGAIIPSKAQNAGDLQEAELAQGMISWASADCPWVHLVEPNTFSRTLDGIRGMAPKSVLSSHLPPALGKTGQLLEILAKAPASTPFVAPDQAALKEILSATTVAS